MLTRIPPNMFVTCFYVILEPENGRLTYANADHDLPYLRRRGGDCEELMARGMPLGIMPGMNYEEKETILDAAEAALLYSDGLVEALHRIPLPRTPENSVGCPQSVLRERTGVRRWR